MIIGLTGGIGSGKSTVAGFLRDEGITVVDADQVAREVVAPNMPGFRAINEHFGDGILANGELNRALLRERIFSDPTEKAWLENLLHPLIREQMLSQLHNATSPYKVLEAPLLFENHLDRICSKSIIVDLPKDLQIKRACERDGLNPEQIELIIASQMARDEKLKRADYVLENSLDLNALKLQTLRLHNILMLLAQNTEFS